MKRGREGLTGWTVWVRFSSSASTDVYRRWTARAIKWQGSWWLGAGGQGSGSTRTARPPCL